MSKYVLTHGTFREVNDELTHGYKYAKKEWRNGRWVYYYDQPDASSSNTSRKANDTPSEAYTRVNKRLDRKPFPYRYGSYREPTDPKYGTPAAEARNYKSLSKNLEPKSGPNLKTKTESEVKQGIKKNHQDAIREPARKNAESPTSKIKSTQTLEQQQIKDMKNAAKKEKRNDMNTKTSKIPTKTTKRGRSIVDKMFNR